MLAPTSRVLSRWQAAGIHLAASFTLALLAGLLIFGIWYPQPYTHAAGADRLVMLLIGIDLVLGPLLTLIVYKHGKKGMAFDIAFIATVQLAALGYGLHVIAQSRPVFVVVTKDVTYLTMASSVNDEDLAVASHADFQSRSWTGPIQAAAPPPADGDARNELLESGLAGKDIDRIPKYFQPMRTAGLELIAAATPLQRLAELAESRVAVDAFVVGVALPIGDLRVQALRGRDPERDQAIVYLVGREEPVGVIDVDPWPALNQDSGAN